MAKILIEAVEPDGLDPLPFYHLYLVYQQDDGTEYVLRAGPGTGFALEPFVGLLEDSVDRRNGATPEERGSRELPLNGRDAEDVWAVMVNYAFSVNTTYNLLTSNSNSFVRSVLDAVGIDVFSYLPYTTSSLELPGIQNLLSSSTIFTGTDDADIIYGADLNDRIFGGGDDDQLFGEADNDVLQGEAGNDVLDGGAGFDTASYEYLVNQGVSVLLSSGGNGQAVAGAGDGDVLASIEHIIGSSQGDTLVAASGNLVLEGGAGNDNITVASNNVLKFDGTNFGDDMVSGSNGIIELNGDQLNLTVEEDNGQYQADGLTFIGDPDDTGLLIEDAYGNSITLADWENGSFGIRLEEVEDEAPAPKIDEGDALINQVVEGVFSDPIVFDLDGDGIELLSVENGVNFDISGDGRIEQVGWVGPNDGLLVLDRNGNGRIDGIDELFGSEDINGFTDLANEEAANGVNNNRIINSTDSPLFGQLQIWQDLNTDGLAQAGELSFLADHNIISLDIRVNSILDDNRWVEGNRVIEVSKYTRSDSTTGEMAEVLFRVDSNTQLMNSAGVYTGSDAALLALPLSRGYGNLVSWQDAMDTNATLRTMIEDFASSTSYTDINEAVEAILYEWAGVSGTSPSSRGEYIDARKMEFMEELRGSEILIQGTDPNPDDAEAAILEEAWQLLFGEFKTRLVVQGPADHLFPNATYDFVTDTFALNDTLTAILTRVGTDPLANNVGFLFDLRGILLAHSVELNATKTDIDLEVATLLSEALGESGLVAALIAAFDADAVIDSVSYQKQWLPTTVEDVYDGTFRNELIITDGTKGLLAGGGGADLLIGSAQNDIIFNGNEVVGYQWTDVSNGDTVFGGAGDDAIYLSGENLLAIGGEGNDGFNTNEIDYSTIDGGEGNDRFTLDGNYLTILCGNGDDEITDNSDVASSLIDLGAGNDLFEAGRANTIYGGFGDDTVFGGGTLDMGEGNDSVSASYDSTVHGGVGSDIITVSNSSTSAESYLYGDEGSDTLTAGGSRGKLWLDGGSGNDVLQKTGSAAVTYVFTAEAGAQDTVASALGYSDRIDLSAFTNITTFTDLVITQNGANAVIDLGNGQSVTLIGTDSASLTPHKFVGGASSGLFVGTDGSDQILGSDTSRGGNGNDTIIGGLGNDSLVGSAGTDVLIGGLGNDTLRGGEYSGVDQEGDTFVITPEANSTDTIQLFRAQYGDRIDLSAFTTIRSMADITIQDGHYEDTLILPDGQTVILYANDLNSIDETSFIFAQGPNEVEGTTGDDTLSGSSIEDSISGGDGNDVLEGLGGADTLLGGIGDDTIYGGDSTDLLYGDEGIDVIYGGAGNDTLYGGSGRDILNGGAGADMLYGDTDTATASYETDTVGIHIDLGNTGAQSGGEAEGDVLVNIHKVIGGSGDDWIKGTESNQTLMGGAGNDTLDGGNQADLMTGGDGADIFRFSSWIESALPNDSDRITDFESGTDLIDLTGLGFTHFTTNSITVAGELRAEYSNGQTYIVSDQDDFGFRMNGDYTGVLTDDGFIFGEPVSGGNGSFLQGTSNGDTLTGGTGDDTLAGGTAADLLTGGTGADIFDFNALTDSMLPNDSDRITDFEDGIDLIELTGLGFTHFTTNSTTASGELRAEYSNGQTYIVSDQEDFGFRLNGDHTTNLSDADFIF